MSPKQFFDFGEAGLRNIGFFKKGWIAVGEDGSVTITNTGTLPYFLSSVFVGSDMAFMVLSLGF